MQQVTDWLEKLGFGQYAQRFADINFGILPHLTDQDLKDLGITSVGHRRQLLLAMADLKDVRKGAAQPPTAVSEPPNAPHDTAKLRQVTVVLSDLVGSTALSARMNPDDLREVISAYHKCVAETVQRFGELAANYMSDGVLVYFRYPQAHEDDPERAVRATFELAVGPAVNSGTPLQTRVGIETGLVVAPICGDCLPRPVDPDIAGGFRRALLPSSSGGAQRACSIRRKGLESATRSLRSGSQYHGT